MRTISDQRSSIVRPLHSLHRERRAGMTGPGFFWLLGLGRLIDFFGRACAWAPWALFRRPGEVIAQFEQVALKSLPIVLGAGFSVGMVAWLQTYRLLAAHGAESTLPSFLAVAVVVELGPLLAGLLVAGRMGAGLAAELASMVQNEEIDARVVLGFRPDRNPRIASGDRLCPGRPVTYGDHRRCRSRRKSGR